MATVLDTFITRFGFQTDKSGLKQAEKGLSDFKNTAIKIAATVGGILGGGFFITKIAEAADETIKWADANGLAVETLGELEFAVQRQGGSIDGLRASLSNMNRAIGEVERGTGRAKLAFEDYGLSIKKANGQTLTADELFIRLNKKFVGLSKAKQFDLAMKMGIDKKTILLLQTAPDEIARLRREAARFGVLSRRDAVKAAAYVDGLTNVAQVISAIKFEIGGLVFEPLTKFFNKIADAVVMLKKHKSILKDLLKVLGAVGTAFLAVGARAFIAWLAALSPITLLIAAIGFVVAALLILKEDFIAWKNGANSAIGDVVKKFPSLGKVIDGIGQKLQVLRNIKFQIIEFILTPIESAIKAFEKLKEISTEIGSLFGFRLSTPLPVGAQPQASFFRSSGQIAGSRTNNIRIGAINVDAKGGDSKEIARNVSSELSNQLKNTVEDFESRQRR